MEEHPEAEVMDIGEEVPQPGTSGSSMARENTGALNRIPRSDDQSTILWCDVCHKVVTNKRALEHHKETEHQNETDGQGQSKVVLVKIRILYWPAKVIEVNGESVKVEVFNREKDVVEDLARNLKKFEGGDLTEKRSRDYKKGWKDALTFFNSS